MASTGASAYRIMFRAATPFSPFIRLPGLQRLFHVIRRNSLPVLLTDEPNQPLATAVRKHPCCSLQLRILQRAMRMLKKGGRIVYSTCSINPVENEAVVAAALKSIPGACSTRPIG